MTTARRSTQCKGGWSRAAASAGVALLLLSLLSGASHAATALAPPAPAPLAAAVDALAAAGFRGVVTSGNREQVLFARAVGLADLTTRRPLTVDERWPWASVTKQLTAILIMQQVEQGRLALDQPVLRYLPQFTGASGAQLTIRQLLKHISGLPNPDSSPAAPGQMPAFYLERGAGIGDMPRALGYCSAAPTAAPGAQFEYNNCDYLVLGAVLEQVTGKRYGELLRTRLGVPGVRLWDDTLTPPAGAVRGYSDATTPAPAANFATLGAAGAAGGTPAELLALDQALLNGRLLGAAALAEMTRGDPAAGYAALGVWSFPAKLAGCPLPVQLVERRGEFGGIQVRNLLAPQLGRALVVLTNDDSFVFGELWQGRGASFDLASAAFCDAAGAARQ